MKKNIAIILAIIIVLAMTACSTNGYANDSDDVVYTGEFTITKLEAYRNGGSDNGYVMAIKNDNVALLFRTNDAVYLKYEIGDVVSVEVKKNNFANLYVQLDNANDGFRIIESIGLED